MILLTIVLLISLAVFIVAFMSPRWGTKTQERSIGLLDRFLAKVRKLPKFWRLILTKPPVLSHKSIHHSAEAGKKVRAKAGRAVSRAAEL